MRTEELREMSNEERLVVKANLRLLMRERGISNMSEVARAIGVEPPTVSKWCSEDPSLGPSAPNVRRLANYFEVPVARFYAREDEPDQLAAEALHLFALVDQVNRGVDPRAVLRRLGVRDDELSRRDWERCQRNAPFLRLLSEAHLGCRWEEATLEQQQQAMERVCDQLRQHGIR